jgi:flagellar biogenesis protein FliO
MPRRSQALQNAIAWIGLGVGSLLTTPSSSRAEDHERLPPTAAMGGVHPTELHRLSPRAENLRRGRVEKTAGSSSGWWLGTGGIAVALVVLGAISLASRRLGAVSNAAGLQVVGRASLSPKHAVSLLRIGDRILIIGTGTQGPPALLGELPASGLASSAPAPRGGGGG